MRRLALRRARWPGLVPRASLLRFFATRAPPAAAAPTTVAKRSERGGAAPAVATHADALAGVSAEYLVEHEERVGHGQRLPVMWNNPGAFGQLHRLSDDMILAMPPPRRPFHPMSESYLTWKYIRSFSIVILFVALALYLQAKSRVKGVARIEAEQRFPGLVRLLVHLGVLEDFAARAVCLGGLCGTEGLFEAHAPFLLPALQATADFGLLAERLLARYGDGDGTTIPVARAAALLARLLLSDGPEDGRAQSLTFQEVTGQGPRPAPRPRVSTAARAGGTPPAAAASRPSATSTLVGATHVATLPPPLAAAFAAAGLDPSAQATLTAAQVRRLGEGRVTPSTDGGAVACVRNDTR